jgi:hypothetical protein
MKAKTFHFVWALIAVLATLPGCRAPSGQDDSRAAIAPAAPPPAARPAPALPTSTTGALPSVLVHKSATCNCCAIWVDHLRAAGFTVEVRNTELLEPIKIRAGVPAGKGACHTAEVGGYFVEGHVPAEDIKRLLREQPPGKGLVLPGMPPGSPGMEVPSGRERAYTVELVGDDGRTTPFAQH